MLLVFGVLGYPKIEIKRNHQRNFQVHFTKLMLKDKGGSTEDRKVLRTSGGGGCWLCLAAFIRWGPSRLAHRGRLLKKRTWEISCVRAKLLPPSVRLLNTCLGTGPGRTLTAVDRSLLPPQESPIAVKP